MDKHAVQKTQVKTEYENYEEATRLYKSSDKWLSFDGTPDRFNIAHECADRHAHLGLAISIKQHSGDTDHVTFRELATRSSQLANWLSGHGFQHGDRALFIQNKSTALYENIFGVIKAGGAVTYLAPVLAPDHIRHIISVLQPKLVVYEGATKDTILSISPVGITALSEFDLSDVTKHEKPSFEYQTSADDLAMIQFTSGTTGMPKPVKLPHKAFVNMAPILRFATGLQQNDAHFHTSTTNLTIGNIGALSFGAHVCTYSGPFDAERVFETFEELKVNSVEMPTTAYRILLQSKELFGRFDLLVKKTIYVMEPIDLSTFNEIKRAFGREPYGQYGATEIGPILADFAAFKNWRVKPLSLGKPYPGQEVEITDDDGNVLPPNQTGFISIRLSGQWRKVGDYGFADDEGYFWFVSRIDDVIKSSGYRLGPEEIESVINTHEAVNASAVVSAPGGQGGQIVKAFIELKPGTNYQEEKLKKEIQSLVKSKIGKHAYPEEIAVIPKIPRTADGKLKRKELRAGTTKITEQGEGQTNT